MRSADSRLSVQESRNQITTNRQALAGGGAANGQAKSRSRKRKRNNQQHQHQQQNRIKQSGRQKSSAQQHTTTTLATPIQNDPSDWMSSTVPTSTSFANVREINDLQHQQQQPTITAQDLLPAIARSSVSLPSSESLYERYNPAADQASSSSSGSSSARMSRSALDADTTLMLSNNVPDDSAGSMSRITSMSQLSTVPFASVASHTSYQGQLGDARTWNPPDARSQAINYGAYTTLGRDTFGPDQFRFIDTCGWPQCNRDCPVLTFEFSSGTSIQF